VFRSRWKTPNSSRSPGRGFPHVSTVEFEVAAGLNLTLVRDETEGDAPQTTPCHRIEPVFLGRDFFPFLLCPLPENTVIMRGASGLELKRDLVPLIIEPMKRLLIILGEIS